MTLSTLSADVSAAPEPDGLAEDTEPADAGKPSCAALVLSVQAKERLKLLNRILEHCIPKSLSARETSPGETSWT